MSNDLCCETRLLIDGELLTTHVDVDMVSFTICSHDGQGGAITTRLLVPVAMHDEVVATAAGVLSGMAVGDPSDPAMMMGPLINERQRDKVDGLVQTALQEGATLAYGGKRPEHLEKGYFYEPTRLANVGENDTIAQEQVCGPVLAVIAYEGSDSEAVRIANNSVYYGPDAPFGGYKQSGIGREMGVAGFEEFLEIKTLAEPVEAS